MHTNQVEKLFLTFSILENTQDDNGFEVKNKKHFQNVLFSKFHHEPHL